MGLGDWTSSWVTPIAGALGHPCVDPETMTIIPGTPCDKRVENLNRFGEAFYDAFWPSEDNNEQ